MRSLITLITSTVILWVVIILVSTALFKTTGRHNPSTSWYYFLKELPGMPVALLCGASGAMLAELMRLREQLKKFSTRQQPAPASLVIAPLVGALAGLILFLLFAINVTTVNLRPKQSSDYQDLGQLLYFLRPTDGLEWMKLSLYTFCAGYFNEDVLKLLEKPWAKAKPNSIG